jgi:hypothetical protein
MLQCVNPQWPIQCSDSLLAIYPFGLDAIALGIFARQGTHDHATPPSRLTRHLWTLRHTCTARLMCHEALSYTIRRAVLPLAANRSANHARHCIVTAQTGRSSTKRRSILCALARNRPTSSCKPKPPAGCATDSAIRRSRHFFSRVLRLRTHELVFNARPIDSQARPAVWLRHSATARSLGHSLCMVDLSGQREGPHARGRATEGAATDAGYARDAHSWQRPALGRHSWTASIAWPRTPSPGYAR